MAGLPVAAVSWGSVLVLAVAVAILFGVIYGLKTRTGSGINDHPGPDSTDPPASGESDPSEAPGVPDEATGTEKDSDSLLDQRGTK